MNNVFQTALPISEAVRPEGLHAGAHGRRGAGACSRTSTWTSASSWRRAGTTSARPRARPAAAFHVKFVHAADGAPLCMLCNMLCMLCNTASTISLEGMESNSCACQAPWLKSSAQQMHRWLRRFPGKRGCWATSEQRGGRAQAVCAAGGGLRAAGGAARHGLLAAAGRAQPLRRGLHQHRAGHRPRAALPH